MQVRFRQAGCGDAVDVYWITPATASTWMNQSLGSISNVVFGTNSFTAPCTIPLAPEVRLVLRSRSYGEIVGYSGVFAVE
jgi:hypothetical protein